MDNLFDEEETKAAQPEAVGLSVRESVPDLGGARLRRTGRPKKEIELAVLAAINEAFPPHKITEALDYAYSFAVGHKSTKGIMQVLEFVAAYQLGQPVKRVVTQRSTVEELLAQAGAVDDDQFEGLIDALYDEHSTR